MVVLGEPEDVEHVHLFVIAKLMHQIPHLILLRTEKFFRCAVSDRTPAFIQKKLDTLVIGLTLHQLCKCLITEQRILFSADLCDLRSKQLVRK